MSAPRIVTFYSYKGGTGRSIALANVAWILAMNGNRVLVIDWDLEAPGLHRYFHPFLDDPSVAMIGVEAAGHGIETGLHAASLNGGQPGVLHGNRTYLLQDDDGQIRDAHSISAGLDYPGIGPEHAWLHDL